jgi:hypothetical protein
MGDGYARYAPMALAWRSAWKQVLLYYENSPSSISTARVRPPHIRITRSRLPVGGRLHQGSTKCSLKTSGSNLLDYRLCVDSLGSPRFWRVPAVRASPCCRFGYDDGSVKGRYPEHLQLCKMASTGVILSFSRFLTPVRHIIRHG